MISHHKRENENNLNAQEIIVRTEMRVASIDSVGARNAREISTRLAIE